MKNKKQKGWKPLTLKERGIIEIRWCKDYKTMTEIALELGRNKSSVSREINKRSRYGRGKYDAYAANIKALSRIQKRGNIPKINKNPRLKEYIEDKMLNRNWSPEQISIRLPIDFKQDTEMRISYEAIYQEIYRRVHRSGNGTVKKGCLDLRPYLIRRHTRRTKKGFRKALRMERNISLPSIEIRPKIVEQRFRIGDWEDDTIVSKASRSRIKSALERKSGIAFFGKAKDGTAVECDFALIKSLNVLPEDYLKTLTRDRGSENIRWKEVERELKLNVFFAHPYCSHERGSNENANGLFRRYFPKKTDFAKVTNEEIKKVEYLINTRPRKRHGGLTLVEVFYKETGVALYS